MKKCFRNQKKVHEKVGEGQIYEGLFLSTIASRVFKMVLYNKRLNLGGFMPPYIPDLPETIIVTARKIIRPFDRLAFV